MSSASCSTTSNSSSSNCRRTSTGASPRTLAPDERPGRPFRLARPIFGRGGAGMLAIIGLVLIALWIIGLAFKVTTGLIHIALVVGLLLVIFNFITGRRATSVP